MAVWRLWMTWCASKRPRSTRVVFRFSADVFQACPAIQLCLAIGSSASRCCSLQQTGVFRFVAAETM
jgi:hypothetical protein